MKLHSKPTSCMTKLLRVNETKREYKVSPCKGKIVEFFKAEVVSSITAENVSEIG